VVKSDIHSTDTHGYSEAIFGLTYMLGFSFAPRLKGLKNMQLYIFKHHDKAKRKTWQITPDNYVNEKPLNKVELANRFTRAVAVGSPREFMQVAKEEQEIAESCNRLIKNSIIRWNYLYLSHKLRKMNDDIEKKEQLLSVISTHSVIT